MKTIHFYKGCPWADGSIQQSDTDQRFTWRNVNCKHCLNNKKSHYGIKERSVHSFIDPNTDTATEKFIKEHRTWFKTNEAHLKNI